MARAVHGVHAVLEKPKLLKLDGLALVDAQEELVASSVPVVALPLPPQALRSGMRHSAPCAGGAGH